VLGRPSGKSELRAKLLVGDWVVVKLSGEGTAVIHAVLPRTTELTRVNIDGKPQRMVANIDHLALVLGADADFQSVHPDRYEALARVQRITLWFVITKPDLGDAQRLQTEIRNAGYEHDVFVIHGLSGEGCDTLLSMLPVEATLALMGNSGVGKSSLLNHLVGRNAQSIGDTRASDGKGKHTTTHREMFHTVSGARIIDTPGMREFDIAKSRDAFADVLAFGGACRFTNCLHQTEPDCAVRLAITEGKLPRERWEAYARTDFKKPTRQS
jgi:ribosome biogenesis GTPase / thiamine phosphate phosphatase